MEKIFTKGKWEAVIYCGEFDQPLIRCGSLTIARVHSQSDRQHEANARLIAAAPELLEALIELYDSIEFDLNIDALSKAKQAIKKATE